MRRVTVTIQAKDRPRAYQVEAESLYAAAFAVYVPHCTMWWWDSSKPIVVEGGADRWELDPRRVWEWGYGQEGRETERRKGMARIVPEGG